MTLLDYFVILAYFAIVLGTGLGVALRRRKKSTNTSKHILER